MNRVGHYEIREPLGAGGMGEVYRAFDPKLGRDVAIKMLPEAFAKDADRLARFEREAKVLAALNHPNIAAIYGVEDRALVMELVEGETLHGPLPLETTLNYARQIAEALEAAHEKGIIHRDLKPANIKITPAGLVKVLDFGLAKAAEEPSATGDPTNSPTLTISPTRAGLIMGTAAYMSPEQARGKPVDKRADIWAFGCVLYEMLTGKQLFHGETVSDILAAVLRHEPDWEHVPPKVRRLLVSCLQKDPKQRLQAIGDYRLLLEDTPSQTAPSRSRLGAAASVAAGVLLMALGILSFIHFRETPPRPSLLRYTIAAPENSRVHSFAISPDGRYVAIAAAVQGKRQQLWLRALDALQARELPGTEDAVYPFWSPDSRFIGFFAQGKLKKIAASGGPAQSLCDATNGRGGSWSSIPGSGEDVIVFSPGGGNKVAIQQVPAAGGVPTDVSTTKGNYFLPIFLPGGRHFLYLVSGTNLPKGDILIPAVALVLAGTLPAQAQESLFGTWKMNAAKSKYSPGPAPKSNTVKWEAFEGGVKLTVDLVPANGETQHWECSGKFDGKDNPVMGNNPDGDSMAFSKIDARTYEGVTKKGGKTTLTAHIVVAANGKSRITTQTGENGQGQTVKNTTFYEKQ